jgi:hypothetical protein
MGDITGGKMKRVRTIACLIAFCTLCGGGGDATPAVTEVGRLRNKSIKEASGLAASRTHADVYWTHNDGDDGVLYAIRSDGTSIGDVKVDAKFKDWEDIAADASGNLYLADCGNNDANRQHMTIYRVAEPDPTGGGKARTTATWRLSFPGKPFNCESLFIVGEYGYIISKHENKRPAGVYRFALATPAKKRGALEHVVDLPIDEPITAADVSRDGKRLAVLGQRGLHVFDIDGDVKRAARATPLKFAIPALQVEGCCFTDDGVLLLIAESGEILRASPPNPAATTHPVR